MRSPRHLREARKRALDVAIRAALRRAARVGPRVVVAFQHLLATVQARTSILSPRTVATDHACRLVDALLAMAVHRWDWRRSLGAWTPGVKATSETLVLGSLAEHLFASFPVPRFMLAAWLGGHRARREQRWYIRLGAGESVRALDFPVPLRRRMAHVFREAPDDLSILAALRWAQVRGQGGSPELARAVAMTRLGRESGDEVFLEHVVAFLVSLRRPDPVLVDALVEFFHGRRIVQAFTSLAGVWPPHTSPRADVAICGLGPKTRDRILRDWGARAPARPRPGAFSWKRAPFGGLAWLRLDGAAARLRTWRIKELCTSDELREEGIAMRHCVATYAPKCANGVSSIWSMTVEEDGRRLRAVTIEVNVERREVCQVKGPSNKPPKKRALEVLRRWIEEQGLTLSPSAAR